MQNKSRRIALLNICNMTAISFYVAVIPVYYILDHPIKQAVFVSCGIYLLLCLLQFVFCKRLRLLLIVLAIFIFHVLSKV